MKNTSLVITIAMLLFIGSSGGAIAKKNRPHSVTEAVQLLSQRLSPEDVQWIRTNPKDTVVAQLHLPYGTGVRNEFGLWGENRSLLDSCGTDFAEECSSIIFQALWDKVRSETDPVVAKHLDCQFSAIRHVNINTKGWFLLRLGALITDLQRQIDQQASNLPPECADTPKIIVRGAPDLQCYVRFEFEQTDNLERILQWASFRNSFSVSQRPPNIELTFSKKCTWPERPKYFAPKPANDG